MQLLETNGIPRVSSHIHPSIHPSSSRRRRPEFTNLFLLLSQFGFSSGPLHLKKSRFLIGVAANVNESMAEFNVHPINPACFFCISSLDPWNFCLPEVLRPGKLGIPNNFSCACCCLLCWNSASAFSCPIKKAVNRRGADLRKGNGRRWSESIPLNVRFCIVTFSSAHSMAKRNPASHCPHLFLKKNTHPFNTNAKHYETELWQYNSSRQGFQTWKPLTKNTWALICPLFPRYSKFVVGISRSLKSFNNFSFHPPSAPLFAPASLGAAVGAHAGGTPRLAALPVSGQARKWYPSKNGLDLDSDSSDSSIWFMYLSCSKSSENWCSSTLGVLRWWYVGQV